MIRIKHLFDPVDKGDGERIWIEPVGLTRDFVEWFNIAHVMSNLGPSKEIAEWFEQHPACFDFFEDQYLTELQSSQYITSLRGLAVASLSQTFTLIYQGDKPNENSAIVLSNFLAELAAHVPHNR
jgi:uncharacterized protein YeaO (DUF488 family)